MKSKIVNNFRKFLESLGDTSKKINPKDVSFRIYYEMFKIREAQWKYKEKFNRKIDYSLSEIFQDLVAHYLKRTLPNHFEVFVEEKKGKLRPDILIKKDNLNWAIIEIKTNIGWNRGLIKEKSHKVRLKELSNEFSIPCKRIFYIFETIRNVNKEFEKNFMKGDFKGDIFSLYEINPSPYYIEKRKGYRKFSDKEILELYKQNKLTGFEEIIKSILNK